MKNFKLVLVLMLVGFGFVNAQEKTINESLCEIAESINEATKDNEATKFIHESIGSPAEKAEKGFCKTPSIDPNIRESYYNDNRSNRTSNVKAKRNALVSAKLKAKRAKAKAEHHRKMNDHNGGPSGRF